jgi:hypothetical protein
MAPFCGGQMSRFVMLRRSKRYSTPNKIQIDSNPWPFSDSLRIEWRGCLCMRIFGLQGFGKYECMWWNYLSIQIFDDLYGAAMKLGKILKGEILLFRCVLTTRKPSLCT